jgi:hypothetical protein
MRALRLISEALQKRIREKGRDCWISLHEIDGKMDEEVREWKGEVHADDRLAAMSELEDIGVTALFGLASISVAIRMESDAIKAGGKAPPLKP